MVRSCLLSGGASQRMGRDKALLPHQAGGSWLEHTLQMLAEIGAPITLLTRWPEHLQLARDLELPQLEAIAEPPPWQGPLLALHRLMELHPDQQLLLCPVDMPRLNSAVLRQLLQAAGSDATAIHLAHDGHRSQPLLGIYPATQPRCDRLQRTLATGERSLQRWLADERCCSVQLKAESIRNVNRLDELEQLTHL
jgi:molybdopterin-guanine dinucleotide biosynthesis protein A